MPGDPTLVGLVGALTIATRGADGPGEVLLRVRGGTETFLAFSEDRLPRGQAVLVVDTRATRTVDVVAWTEEPAGWPGVN